MRGIEALIPACIADNIFLFFGIFYVKGMMDHSQLPTPLKNGELGISPWLTIK